MKRRRRLTALCSLLLLLLGTAWALSRPKLQTIEVDGFTRRYLLVAPPVVRPDQPIPVLFALHGGGGNARGFSQSGFSRLARSRGYLVVYPEGLERSWNDGYTRPLSRKRYRADDVAFLNALLGKLKRDFPVDPNRVYVAGISNGALMSHAWAMANSQDLAAIAPIAGGMSEALAQEFQPSHPVSVLVIQGTADPLIPYGGGPVQLFGRKGGTILSTSRYLELWNRHNDCGAPSTKSLPDTSMDGCRVEWTAYAPGREGSEVVLCKVIGGGHTIPGGRQYLPKPMIGTVCRDIDGVEVMADFFDNHSSLKDQPPR